MFFIGNDIVALKSVENLKSFSKPNYIDRMLHSQEKVNFLNSVSNAALYWSIKESVYKVSLKQGHTVSFAPALFNIFEIKSDTFKYSGKVFYNNCVYYFFSEINSNFCLTVSSDTEQITNQKRINISVSNYFNRNKNYQVLYTEIGNRLNLDISKFTIEKDNNGIPFILYNQKNIKIDISLSHDGNYFTYAWMKTE